MKIITRSLTHSLTHTLIHPLTQTQTLCSSLQFSQSTTQIPRLGLYQENDLSNGLRG